MNPNSTNNLALELINIWYHVNGVVLIGFLKINSYFWGNSEFGVSSFTGEHLTQY